MLMNNFAITAIVLAAGFSQRMGRFKPLLSLGGGRTIERGINLFHTAGVEDILVVTGHCATDIQQALRQMPARCVKNQDYRRGMFSSVLAGIRALPSQCGAFFIHPADIPLVRTQTVRRLMAVGEFSPASILYPTFDGQRGHPTLIQRRLGAHILRWRGDGGLRALLAQYETESLELPVEDEAVLWDLDTPRDYSRMLARLARANQR